MTTLSTIDFLKLAALTAGKGELSDGVMAAYLAVVGCRDEKKLSGAFIRWMRMNASFPAPSNIAALIRAEEV